MEQRFKDFGYTRIYPKLTAEYKELQPNLFKLGILMAQQQEAEMGMYLHRQYKANEFGTKIYFKYENNKDKLAEYKVKVNRAAEGLLKTMKEEDNNANINTCKSD